MGKIVSYILSLFLVAILIQSCTNECLENKSSIGLAGFYSSDNLKAINIDSLTVFGVGAPNDSLILNNEQSVKQVYLPMRANVTSVQFVLHYNQVAISSPLLNDTLTLNYKSIAYFVSEECGAMYQYEIKDFSYTKHIIDSIAIPSMKITNIDEETIKIFMRTKAAE